MTHTHRFTGHIAGVGTSGGTRLVLGCWDRTPHGPFADVMVAHPDGRRELLAPDAWVADSNLLTHDPYVARKGIQVTRAPEQVQRLALRLTLVGFLEAHHDMNGPFITSFRAYPDDVQFAHHLHETGQLAALRERRAALEEVLALLDGHA